MKELSQKAKDRILVAQDVISQLKLKKFTATAGTYVDITVKDDKDLFRESDAKKGKDVRDVLQVRAKKCRVCAKGAILISTIMKFDNMPVPEDFTALDLGDLACTSDYESPFTETQLDLMESAFEGFTEYPHGKEEEGLVAIYQDHEDDEDRLIVIMQNVVENQGTFKPAKYKAKDEAVLSA